MAGVAQSSKQPQAPQQSDVDIGSVDVDNAHGAKYPLEASTDDEIGQMKVFDSFAKLVEEAKSIHADALTSKFSDKYVSATAMI